MMNVENAPNNKYSLPLNIDSYDYRAICLFCACVIYALWGSPTPDKFALVEVLVGLFLVLSIGIGRARDALLQPVKLRFWKSAGQVFLIYGLSIPLVVGVMTGNNISIILRDIIPFLFLFLPMFLLPLLRARPYYFRSSLVAILLVGFLFSLRSIMARDSGNLLYLENMPTVLFSALFLLGAAMSFVMKGGSARNIAGFSVLIALGLVPILAMALTLQRASLGAVVIYIVIMLGVFLYRSPMRAAGLFALLCIVLLIVNISFSSIFSSLLNKSAKVGLNMRPQEFSAVWEVVSSDPLVFLFGRGWGATFNSPAVGNLSVNFTHNFFSYVLFKMGALGIICCISYIAGLLERLVRVILANPVLGFALAAPILIDLTLYASFKSLDFGLVLLMISGSLVYYRQSESRKV